MIEVGITSDAVSAFMAGFAIAEAAMGACILALMSIALVRKLIRP